MQPAEDNFHESVLFAGIAKSFNFGGPSPLRAAFKVVSKKEGEYLAFCSAADGLESSTLNSLGSITAYFNLSAEEAIRGLAALEQTEADITAGRTSLETILDWNDATKPGSLQALYQPTASRRKP